MHTELNELIFVVEVGLTEFDIDLVGDEVKVSRRLLLELSLEVEFEIFDLQPNLGSVWEDFIINMLGCSYCPLSESWELNLNHTNAININDINVSVDDIEESLRVSDVGPVELP